MPNNVYIVPASSSLQFSGSVSSSVEFKAQADGTLLMLGKDGGTIFSAGPNESDGIIFYTSSVINDQTIDGDLTVTGSIIVTGNLSGNGSQLTSVSASNVNFFDISDKPTLVSSSVQVNADTITNFDTNVKDKMNVDGVISSSVQVNHDQTTNYISGEHYLQSEIVEVGTLNTGSISSGFGDINIGSSTFSTTGDVTTGNLVTSGSLTISGSLVVLGETIEAQITELYIEDKTVTIASGSVNGAASDGAGLEIDRGSDSNVALTWDNTADRFDFNKGLVVSGSATVTNALTIGPGTLGTYQTLISQDSGGTADLLTLENDNVTYNQTFKYRLDTNKDLLIIGGSAAGGIVWSAGSRGYTFNGGGGATFAGTLSAGATTATSLTTSGNISGSASSTGSFGYLNVNGNISAIATSAKVVSPSNQDSGKLRLGNVGGSITGETSGGLAFRIGSGEGIEYARIDATGSLLIGTTTSFVGGTVLQLSTTSDKILAWQRSGASDNYYLGADSSGAILGNATSATLLAYFPETGGLRIGTTSATSHAEEVLRLLVPSTGRALNIHANSSNSVYQQFTNSTTGTTSTDGFIVGLNGNEAAILRNEEATPLIVYTSATERFRISSQGSASFGTTTPESGYQVTVDGGLYVSSSIGGATVFKVEGTSGSLFEISDSFEGTIMSVSDQYGFPFFVVSGSGNVGINTDTPSHELDVNGTGSFSGGIITGGTTTLDGNTVISGSLTVTGTITEQSTRNVKENIRPLYDELTTVLELQPVSYNKKGSTDTEFGLLAEEVAKIYPELVTYNEDDGTPTGVQYTRLTVVLLQAIKELNDKIQEQQIIINSAGTHNKQTVPRRIKNFVVSKLKNKKENI